MTPAAQQTLRQLRTLLRPASVAKVGGFRPPDDPTSSRFGAGVRHADEGLPMWNGKPMFPLLQIRVDELPVVPEPLKDTALLVLFHNPDQHPFNRPHGDGWLIREYGALDGLVPLPKVTAPAAPRPMPVVWTKVGDDAPGWEDAWDILDLGPVNRDAEATSRFFKDFNRYDGTKVGGYPADVQHGVGLDNFVFQVGSEEKARWRWADSGIGYFFKDRDGQWSWSCQIY